MLYRIPIILSNHFIPFREGISKSCKELAFYKEAAEFLGSWGQKWMILMGLNMGL